MIAYSADRSTPAQYECSSPSSDFDEHSVPEPYSMPRELDGPTPDNPLMSSLLPGSPPQEIQLMPPGWLCICTHLYFYVNIFYPFYSFIFCFF